MSISRIGVNRQNIPRKTGWIEYTPTLTDSGSGVVGNFQQGESYYRRHGDLVICQYRFFCSLLTSSSGYWGVSIPFKPKTDGVTDAPIGTWYCVSGSSDSVVGEVLLNSADTTTLQRLGAITPASTGGAQELRYLGDGSSSMTIASFPSTGRAFSLDLDFFYEAQND